MYAYIMYTYIMYTSEFVRFGRFLWWVDDFFPKEFPFAHMFVHLNRKYFFFQIIVVNEVIYSSIYIESILYIIHILCIHILRIYQIWKIFVIDGWFSSERVSICTHVRAFENRIENIFFFQIIVVNEVILYILVYI